MAELQQLTREEIKAHAAHYDVNHPAIYCGTYAKYNRGSLYGMWIDLTTFDTHAEFMTFCKRLHRDEADPELMFQDYEHFPETWYSEGYLSVETFNKIKMYANLEEDKREAFCAYLENWSDGTIEDCINRYMGKFDSDKEFAEHIVVEGGYLNNLPTLLQGCIDYDSVWYNLKGDYTEINKHYFMCC